MSDWHKFVDYAIFYLIFTYTVSQLTYNNYDPISDICKCNKSLSTMLNMWNGW